MSASILQFPARGAFLQLKVEDVEAQVVAWLGEGSSWLAYSDEIARWVLDPGLPDLLRKFDAAGGRVAYAEHVGSDMFDGVCAELAAEFLAATEATLRVEVEKRMEAACKAGDLGALPPSLAAKLREHIATRVLASRAREG